MIAAMPELEEAVKGDAEYFETTLQSADNSHIAKHCRETSPSALSAPLQSTYVSARVESATMVVEEGRSKPPEPMEAASDDSGDDATKPTLATSAIGEERDRGRRRDKDLRKGLEFRRADGSMVTLKPRHNSCGIAKSSSVRGVSKPRRPLPKRFDLAGLKSRIRADLPNDNMDLCTT